MAKGILGMILAGGEGSRLRPLTENRSKPAVPFGGSYRLIDFALSNFLNADLLKIFVLTQFKSQSLYHHMKRGWNITGLTDRFIDPIPAQMRVGKRWYDGTADAIYQNLRFVELSAPEQVAIFGSDHIYKMDIRQIVDFHKQQQADLTVCAIKVPIEEASAFGVIEVNDDGLMIGFEEKPQQPKCVPGDPEHALVSMGNYIFDTEILIKELEIDAKNIHSSHDFGKDIIPKLYPEGKVYVYDFEKNAIPGEQNRNYWRDVGTIDAYWQSHMDLLGDNPAFSLDNPNWPLNTYYPPLPPATFTDAGHAKVKIIDSLISSGCLIQGANIHKSVLGFSTKVGDSALISESIILGDCHIGAGCSIRRAILDKNITLAPGTVIGENLEQDAKRFDISPNGIVIVSKNSKVGF